MSQALTTNIEIPGLDDFEELVTAEDLRLRIMLYGPMGVGKTALASSVADHPLMRPVLFVNIENGQISVPHYRRKHIQRKDLYSPFQRQGESHSDLQCLDMLEAWFWRIQSKHPAWSHFRTVVIDSASELQSISSEDKVLASLERDRKLGDKMKHPDRRLSDMFPEDYKANTDELRRIVRMFRDLPLNLVLVSHHKETYSRPPKGQESTLIAVEPTFNQKLGESLMGMMDMVMYMGSSGGERKVLMQPYEVFRAKTRPPRLAEYLGKERPIRLDQPFFAQVMTKFLELEHDIETEGDETEELPETENVETEGFDLPAEQEPEETDAETATEPETKTEE